MTAESHFIEQLVATAPELVPLLDQEGELLAYLFMGEVAGWLQESSATGS